MVAGVVIIGFTVLEFARPREERAPEGSAAPAGQVVNVPVPLRPAPAVRLRRPLGGQVALTTDKAEKPTSTLFGVSSTEDKVAITPLTRAAERKPAGAAGFRVSSRPDVVQLHTQRAGRRHLIAYAITKVGARLRVDQHDLDRGGRLSSRALSAPTPLPPGARRDVRVATWSGKAADLFVIDRRTPDRTVRVRVLSGESKFQDTLVAATIGQGFGFPPSRWSLDVGRVAGGRPDVLLVSRHAATPSKNTEVHVLSGDANYSEFHMQVRSSQPAGRARRAVLGYRNGSPTWFSAAAGSDRAQPFVLHRPQRRKGPA